jgi:hypothetical protein
MFARATAAAGMGVLPSSAPDATVPVAGADPALVPAEALPTGAPAPTLETAGKESTGTEGNPAGPRGMDAAAMVESLLSGMKGKGGKAADLVETDRRKGMEKKDASTKTSEGKPSHAVPVAADEVPLPATRPANAGGIHAETESGSLSETESEPAGDAGVVAGKMQAELANLVAVPFMLQGTAQAPATVIPAGMTVEDAAKAVPAGMDNRTGTLLRNGGQAVVAAGREAVALPGAEMPTAGEQRPDSTEPPSFQTVEGPAEKHPNVSPLTQEKFRTGMSSPEKTGESPMGSGKSAELPGSQGEESGTAAVTGIRGFEASKMTETARNASEIVIEGITTKSESAGVAALARQQGQEVRQEGKGESVIRELPSGTTVVNPAQTVTAGRHIAQEKSGVVPVDPDPAASAAPRGRETAQGERTGEVLTETAKVSAGKKEGASSGNDGMQRENTGTGGEGRTDSASFVQTARFDTTVRERGEVSPAAQPARGQSALHESIISQVRDTLVSHDPASGTGQVTLKLNPRELGDLQIHLRIEDQKVHVEINAANPVVKEALLQNLDQLKDTLTRQNIVMERFDVSSGGNMGAEQSFREGRQAGQQRFENTRYPTGAYYTAENPEAQVAYWETGENSLVDVRL